MRDCTCAVPEHWRRAEAPRAQAGSAACSFAAETRVPLYGLHARVHDACPQAKCHQGCVRVARDGPWSLDRHLCTLTLESWPCKCCAAKSKTRGNNEYLILRDHTLLLYIVSAASSEELVGLDLGLDVCET